MSWHSDCSLERQYKNYGDPHMKPNRYAFVEKNGTWNCVKYGGNFDDKYWIVSDLPLTKEQMKVTLSRMGLRPGIDKLVSVRTLKRFGKAVLCFKIEW